MRGSMSGASPEADLAKAQLRHLLEQAVEQLPSEFRPVFGLREIEGMNVQETVSRQTAASTLPRARSENGTRGILSLRRRELCPAH